VTASTVPLRPFVSAGHAVDESVLTRLKWLLVFRLLVISVLLISSVVVRATTDEELFARAAVALYAVAAVAYATVLGGAVVIRVRPSWATTIAYSQLISDALIATAVVWLTGGAESVFVFIYSLSVLNAAIVLHRQAALVLAGVSVTLFSVVALALAHEPLRTVLPSLATNGASFFLVAVLSGYLTTQLTKTSARLQDARAQILKLEGLYEAVLGSLPSGVLSVGQGGSVVFANAAATETLGISTDVVGRDVAVVAPGLSSVLSRIDADRFELEVDLGARGRRVLGGSVAPLVGVDDPGRVVVFQDLTELRRLQEDVARSERLAELGRLAAGLAHEVRNPLAAMIGCLQLLGTDEKTQGDSGKLLGIVQREAERLSGLVQAFLTYARPAEPTPQRVALVSLLEETAAAIRLGLQSADLFVVGVVDHTITVDPDQLRQVLWNVITNADRIGAGLGRRVRIEVGAHDGDDNDVVIFVDDDGPGVPEELRQRIFEPFFTTRSDGNGLGLATSHQLVQRNGGVMGAGRSPLGGARFTIRFPAATHPVGE
jgi:two-component system sensor histidine kinase PilS (NtrC family)